jgi:hypothetical protein
MWNVTALFVVASIVFCACGLFAYWGSRVVALLNSTEVEIDKLLDADLAMGRMILQQIRGLFAPPQTFLLP